MFPSDTENKLCVLLRPTAGVSERTFKQLRLRSLTVDEPHTALIPSGSDLSLQNLELSSLVEIKNRKLSVT